MTKTTLNTVTDDSLSGVMTVLPTAFTDRGLVDLDSIGAVVDFAINEGSNGLVCFGLASELYKLSDRERTEILTTVIERVNGRVPVVAGSESNSIETACARTADYCELGVAAVMVLPPSFVKPDEWTVYEYYREVAASAGDKPVIVQDAPGWTGVPLPTELLQRVRESAENVSYVKVENPPNHAKLSALASLGFTCLGGYGALHLLEDVDAGISGVLYGAGTIAEMVDLWQLATSGSDRAWQRYERMLPLLSFQMSSLDTFIATQKHLLHQAAVIKSTYSRRPGRELSAHQKSWVDQLVARLKEDLL